MKLKLTGPDFEFVRPYVERALPEEIELSESDAACHTLLCSAGQGASLAASHPEAAVLQLPVVIGTGMTGMPRKLVERIWRGTFFHLRDVETPVEAVHAVDVAAAVMLTAGRPGLYAVTDGAPHDLDELADALSARLGDKRILTAPRRWGRFLPGYVLRRRFADIPRIFGGDFIAHFDFKPHNVSDYLRTHVYDENSL